MNIPYRGVGALGAAPYIINASRKFIIWPWNVLVWLHDRSVQLFGPGALGQVLNAPHPVILPFILYENSFDVHVFILL